MKLLIIGDAYSQFVRSFAKELKNLGKTVDIDILNISAYSGENHREEITNLYGAIYSYNSLSGIVGKIPKLRGIIRKIKAKRAVNQVNRQIDKYDVILIHGFWAESNSIYLKLNSNKVFTVGSFWGSDFYKRDPKDRKLVKVLDRCDRVNIATQLMTEDILAQELTVREKIRNCLFGLTPLKLLFENQQISSNASKRFLGYEEDRIIITCGYNGSRMQQHLRILSSLMLIKNLLSAKIMLVVPMTYGGDEAYKKEIINALELSEIDYVIYEKFLTDIEIVHLRKATDIMIQTQVTDAFSGSMQEHLFAQNVVITGSWLPYQSLKDEGVYFETIDNMEELASKLSFVIDNLQDLKIKVRSSNLPEIFKPSLWSECIKDWYKMLNEYKQV